MGLQAIVRGKPIRTTFPDKTAPSPLDRVSRQFKVRAPKRLWASDFTYDASLTKRVRYRANDNEEERGAH